MDSFGYRISPGAVRCRANFVTSEKFRQLIFHLFLTFGTLVGVKCLGDPEGTENLSFPFVKIGRRSGIPYIFSPLHITRQQTNSHGQPVTSLHPSPDAVLSCAHEESCVLWKIPSTWLAVSTVFVDNDKLLCLLSPYPLNTFLWRGEIFSVCIDCNTGVTVRWYWWMCWCGWMRVFLLRLRVFNLRLKCLVYTPAGFISKKNAIDIACSIFPHRLVVWSPREDAPARRQFRNFWDRLWPVFLFFILLFVQ